MSRLTRDGTAEPVSRDQILRHARGQGNIHFPCSADHEQDWQPYPVDPYSTICDDHTYVLLYLLSRQSRSALLGPSAVIRLLSPLLLHLLLVVDRLLPPHHLSPFRVTRYTVHITQYTGHVTHYTLPVHSSTRYTIHVTEYTSQDTVTSAV